MAAPPPPAGAPPPPPSNATSAALAPPGSKRESVKNAIKGVIGPQASAVVGSTVHSGAAAVNGPNAPPQGEGAPPPTTSDVLAPPGSKRAALKGLFKKS